MKLETRGNLTTRCNEPQWTDISVRRLIRCTYFGSNKSVTEYKARVLFTVPKPNIRA